MPLDSGVSAGRLPRKHWSYGCARLAAIFCPVWAKNFAAIGNVGAACVIKDQLCPNAGISHRKDCEIALLQD